VLKMMRNLMVKKTDEDAADERKLIAATEACIQQLKLLVVLM